MLWRKIASGGPKKIWRACGAPEKIVWLIILPLEIAIFESKKPNIFRTSLEILAKKNTTKNKIWEVLNLPDFKTNGVSWKGGPDYNTPDSSKEVFTSARTIGNRRYEFNGEQVPKSKVYSLIALHNLEVVQNEINHFLESEIPQRSQHRTMSLF